MKAEERAYLIRTALANQSLIINIMIPEIINEIIKEKK